MFSEDEDKRLLEDILNEHPLVTEPVRIEADIPRLIGLLETGIKGIEAKVHFYDVGTVQHVGNGVATLSGLPRASINELVTFPTGIQGMVLNLDRDHIDVILLGEDEGIRGGDLVTATGQRSTGPGGYEPVGKSGQRAGRTAGLWTAY